MIGKKPLYMILYIFYTNLRIIQIIRNSLHPFINTVKSQKWHVQPFICHFYVLWIIVNSNPVSACLLTYPQKRTTAQKRIQNRVTFI